MTRVLLITKGHPFAKDDFFEIFDELVKDTNSCVSDYTHVEQPAAQHFFHPENSQQWDVFVMYDMPGIKFNRSQTDRENNPVEFDAPSDAFKRGVYSMLENGKGLIFYIMPLLAGHYGRNGQILSEADFIISRQR